MVASILPWLNSFTGTIRRRLLVNYRDDPAVIADDEVRQMMLAGKHAPAREMIRQRTGIAAGNENSLARGALLVIAKHGDPVGHILAGDARPRREHPRADVFQTD